MTKRDTLRVMAILEASYPSFYRDGQREAALELWSELFADDDPVLVASAVKTFIASDEKGFPPVIGQIKSIMARLTENIPNASDAWNLVKRAIGRSGYGADEEFRKLPKEVQRAVGSPNQLKEWSQMDLADINNVIAPSFRKAYAAIESDEKAQRSIPKDVQKAIEGTKPLQIEGEAR